MSNRTWSQTKTELTISVRLPPNAAARDVRCSVVGDSVTVGLKSGVPLFSGELWGHISSNVWSVESGTFNLEIEKARAQFWPCALRGDPEIDVSELVAKDKKDREPAYKLPPDTGTTPRQVTDRETIRKLKAEFPHLDLPVDDSHTAMHRNHAGPRRAFEWGAIPTDADLEPAAASTAKSHVPTPPLPSAPPAAPPRAAPPPPQAVPASPAASPTAASVLASKDAGGTGSTRTFEWGATPTDSEPSPTPAVASAASAPKYSWGPLGGVGEMRASGTSTAPVGEASAQMADGGTSSNALGKVPPPQDRYQWGALPPS